MTTDAAALLATTRYVPRLRLERWMGFGLLAAYPVFVALVFVL